MEKLFFPWENARRRRNIVNIVNISESIFMGILGLNKVTEQGADTVVTRLEG